MGIGNYVKGYLSGNGLILDSNWLRIGLFERNHFLKGSSFLRGNEIRIRADSYVNNMPDSNSCVITYEEGTFYDGEMKEGQRHGEGIMTYNGGSQSREELVLKAT